MKTRHKRLLLILAGLAVLGGIAALVLNAFQSNLVFFFSPTQVAAGEAPKGKPFRIGGMVKEGSIRREADGVTLSFVVTDTEKDIAVRYKGILPDLFKEGKGAVAQGKLGEDGIFAASEVLAKHGLAPRLMIDASHANSGKNPDNQPAVVEDIARQLERGETRIVGVMVESHLVGGRQDLVDGCALTYGQSITDGCLGWERSVEVLERLAAAVRTRRAHKREVVAA